MQRQPGNYGNALLASPDLAEAERQGRPPPVQGARYLYKSKDNKNEERVLLCAPFAEVAACSTRLSL